MVFTTHLFLFYYLPLILTLYYILPFRARTALIAAASYLFYGWANPWWAVLMFLSSGVDYVCGIVLLRESKLPCENGLPPILPKSMPRTRLQTSALVLSIISNMGLLAFFKYYGFTQENLNAIAHTFGLGRDALPELSIVLPVGISFYTFKSMSYAIDVYRGDARPMLSFIDFCCFEAFFPDLVAGPIVRYAAIEQQMRQRSHTTDKFARGVAFFALGMAKKIVLANPMGQIADTAFSAGALHWYDAWYGIIGYAFQIYFDFSGYSDMALGLALMMGFVLIRNFDDPYCADSITDFWRRWHISLSTWLRDYLYIPLGGNRKGEYRTYLNLMIVMVLGGLWHGASWNFVIWGAIHGGLLAFERYQGKDSAYRRLPRALRIAVTFICVCIGWVFFRADTLDGACRFIAGLAGFGAVTAGSDAVASMMYTPFHIVLFATAAAVVWSAAASASWEFTRRLSVPRAAVCLSLFVLSVLLMWTQSDNPFLYFQF